MGMLLWYEEQKRLSAAAAPRVEEKVEKEQTVESAPAPEKKKAGRPKKSAE